MDRPSAWRFSRLPLRRVGEVEVPVAITHASRLLGLAWLEHGQAGRGLLIPGCRSVHTFGMRFAIEVVFLDRDELEIRRIPGVAPRRLLAEPGAGAVLELVP